MRPRSVTRARPNLVDTVRIARASCTALVVCLAACAAGVNYADPAGPRFGAPLPTFATPTAGRDTLRVVTFNVQMGIEVDSALAVLRSEPDLADADLILLQEMDEAGMERLAAALGMGYVYYPAMRRHSTGRNLGNGILSRWPLESDQKLVLPHLGVFGSSQRIAAVATVRVGRTSVRVYSVHLATPVNQAERDRMDQMRAVLRDAAGHPFVILGGDLNSGTLGRMAEERGYLWPTKDGPRTTLGGRFDHILFRGLRPPDTGAAGTVAQNRGASDHLPVWALAVLP